MKTTISDSLKHKAKQQLASNGHLRVAVNLSNFLLVSTQDPNGEPDGVSPAVARAIADDLGTELRIVSYEGPGQIADAAGSDQWDIANIAAEPARAKYIHFSPAYCEIQATYLLPPESPIKSIEDVDKPGHRIAVKERSAYDLWLTENLRHATLQRAPSLDESFTLFANEKLDALAGLRPKLLEQQSLMDGSRLFDESFTAVQQSIGCGQAMPEAANYLTQFVELARENGLIAQLIDHYGVSGRLSVAG
jgi:polar amino acid transport system substrate-binding protein